MTQYTMVASWRFVLWDYFQLIIKTSIVTTQCSVLIFATHQVALRVQEEVTFQLITN